MSRKAGVRGATLVVALAIALVATAAAVASRGLAPRLLSPNHKHLAPGRIRLVVEVPIRPAPAGVFITVSRTRKLDKYGLLKACASSAHGCDFDSAGHWKGHDYSYVGRFDFPGYWSVTPGRYYWQADYLSDNPPGNFYSGIGWFVVK
jgi:hypothetical protein